MASKKSATLPRPDVSADIQTVPALELAFGRELPDIPEADPRRPPMLSSPEVHARKQVFTLFVWACVDALFDAEPAPRPKLFTEWTPVQRALITQIAKLKSNVMVNIGDLSMRLRGIGMFDIVHGDGRYLDRYAGLTPKGVLEHIEEERPLWYWLRLCLLGEASPEDLVRVTATLDNEQRMELVRLCVSNCYQLMRRWPLPNAITPEQEAQDAASLFDVVRPILAVIEDATLLHALQEEIARPHPEFAIVLLVVSVWTERGHALGEGEASWHEALAEAADLYPVHGRRLLGRCSAPTRAAVLALMEPVAHNLSGFWTYVDLLEPDERAERITFALATFQRPCNPTVAARVAALLAELPPGARLELEKIAQGNGPNAGLIKAALAQAN